MARGTFVTEHVETREVLTYLVAPLDPYAFGKLSSALYILLYI